MLKLYSFYWDCGRMGNLDGLFVAEESEVAKILGKEVYFGEVLGKHSEIYGTVDEEDITVVSDDQEKIEWLIDVIGGANISGYNPLEYYDPEDDEDSDEE